MNPVKFQGQYAPKISMKIVLIIAKLVCTCLIFSSIQAQNLDRVKVMENERKEGVVRKYSYNGKYDGSIDLLLYKRNRYEYFIRSTNYFAFSQGEWSKENRNIYLYSDVSDKAVPVLVKYLTNDSVNLKSHFLIPINLKGDRFPDARIYVNNVSTYCFPFFDTCIGNFDLLKRIKIDFGDGFESEWITLESSISKKIQPIVQTEFVLHSYLSFNRRQYRLEKSALKLITSVK